jgi:hypothetical protein
MGQTGWVPVLIGEASWKQRLHSDESAVGQFDPQLRADWWYRQIHLAQKGDGRLSSTETNQPVTNLLPV